MGQKKNKHVMVIMLFLVFSLFISVDYYFPEQSEEFVDVIIYFAEEIKKPFYETSDILYNPPELVDGVGLLKIYFIDVGQGDSTVSLSCAGRQSFVQTNRYL